MSEEILRADGKLVRHLRWNHGWTQEDLAMKVGCAKRTIENLESGKPISVKTLRDVAQALRVAPETLRLHDRPPATEVSKDTVELEAKCPQDVPGDAGRPDDAARDGQVAVDTDVARLELVIENVEFDSWTGEEQERLLRLIRETLELSGDIRVLSKRRGSVVLTIEMTREGAERLRWAVKGGQLAELGIVEAREVAEPPTPGHSRAEAETVPLMDPGSAAPAKSEGARGTGLTTSFRLLVLRGRQRGMYVVFPPGEFIIGRGSECHIRARSVWVSRQHCSLQVRRTTAQIRDLGSTNGTLLNGVRVSGECWLCDRDQLQVGRLVFEVRFDKSISVSKTVPSWQADEWDRETPRGLHEGGSGELPTITLQFRARPREETIGPGPKTVDGSESAEAQDHEP
jgi:transcriptional regulator with XRE-family HTH domain